jgi:hypothetical protein
MQPDDNIVVGDVARSGVVHLAPTYNGGSEVLLASGRKCQVICTAEPVWRMSCRACTSFNSDLLDHNRRKELRFAK